jgi:hypothetical protein
MRYTRRLWDLKRKIQRFVKITTIKETFKKPIKRLS